MITEKHSYNLIVTPRLMWVVMRECSSIMDEDKINVRIDVNSLGFVGTLAVKNEESMKFMKKLGPLSVLR